MEEIMPEQPDGQTANFSPAVRAGDLLFVSGQASVDEYGQVVSGTFAEELDRSMGNIARVLALHGATTSQVVKVSAYLANPADVPEFNALYRNYFSPPLPARTTITGCLPSSVKFEIAVIAHFPAS
jgi:2-iminobutanoate/2-iminopropanoate deaminase